MSLQSATTQNLDQIAESWDRDEETENVIALLGFLLANVIIFILVFLFCKRADETAQGAAQNLATVEAAEKEAKENAVKADIPPSYSFVVSDKTPPPYLDSVLNESINPELNREWASDLDLKRVDPQVVEVVERARANSLALPERPVAAAAAAARARAARGSRVRTISEVVAEVALGGVSAERVVPMRL